MEEALEEENNSKLKNIFSFIFQNISKNGRSQANYSEDLQNSGNVRRMEEAFEEENNSKLRNIFSFFFQKILEEWKKLEKIFRRPAKLWKCWKNRRSFGRRK